MIVTIKCIMCKKDHSFEVKKEDMIKYQSGEGYVQEIFSYLSAGQREMFISKTCETCFDNLYKEEE